MSYDPKCEELAKYFLEDFPGAPVTYSDLAEIIQDAIFDQKW